MIVVGVALAGALGALARYSADVAIGRRWKVRFPAATLIINVTGALLLGVLTGLSIRYSASSRLRADVLPVVGTGFCGGYTTFSTATFESVRLIQQRCYRLAALNVVASIGLTTLAAGIGIIVTD